MKKLLALLEALIAFIKNPIGTIKNKHIHMVEQRYSRLSEERSDATYVAKIKENIADAKHDMVRAQTDEDEESRRFYAKEAATEIREAIEDCKCLKDMDEAHHYFGIIGRAKIIKWSALPTIALAIFSVLAGQSVAAAIGYANNVLAEVLLSFGIEFALAIPGIFFVTRVLFRALLSIKIGSLESLESRILGVKTEVVAEN